MSWYFWLLVSLSGLALLGLVIWIIHDFVRLFDWSKW